MMRGRSLMAAVVFLTAVSAPIHAQTVRAVPRPLAPIPEWLGQTRAPRPAPGKGTAAFDVETVAEGFSGAFCFSFLPDGRMLVGERPGHIKIVRPRGFGASAGQVGEDAKIVEVGGL